MRLPTLFLLLTIPVLLMAQKTNYEQIDSLREVIKQDTFSTEGTKALVLHDLATLYMHTSNYVQAANFYSQSLDIAAHIKAELLEAMIYRNMGVLSSLQGNYDKVEEYNQKALMIYEKKNDKIRKAELIKLIADNLLNLDDTLNARKYYEEALPIFRSNGNRVGEAMVLSNYALTFPYNYPEKIRLALEAQKVFDSIHIDNPLPATNAGNIGVAYLDIVRYNLFHLAPPGQHIPAGKKELLQLAEKYIRQAISTANSKQDTENSSYFTGVLAELQEYNGDYKNAYRNIRVYFETRDSLFSQSNKNKIAALQNKQELDLKNSEIETRKLQVRNQRTQMLLLAGGLLLVLVLGLFIYRENKNSKRNNRLLQSLNKELSVSNEIKARFFAIISHDLRSPIARLVSFLQYRKLKPGALTIEQQEQHEQKIGNAAEALLASMESMLLWSKDQMAHFQPVLQPVKIAAVFEYIRNNFANIDTIDFRFDVPNDLSLHTDENYLRTILYNLTSNAVGALQSTPSATIEWKGVKEGDTVVLSIADNGPGLAPAQATTFFEDQAITNSAHGLGLYIVRDLAKAIGCKLSVAPSEKGLTILLSFHHTA